MRFIIYDDAGAGSLLWDSEARTVAVAGGIFSVLLGASPQPSITLDFAQDYWLEVTVAGDVQSPRVRLGSVSHAYMASGLVQGTEVSGSVTSGTSAAFKGTNTATSGTVYGGRFETPSSSGRGVLGMATATTGTTYGIGGYCYSTGGTGVYGYAAATTGTTYAGLFENASENGRGVYAYVSATSGGTYGIYGHSASVSGTGVYAYASATTGTTNGIYSRTNSTSGRGIFSTATATTGTTYGVYGENCSTEGTGVRAYAYATTGATYGVYGRSDSGSGFGVYYSGNLAGTGTKSRVVKTSKGPTLMYCQESPENWFEDVGEGRLVNGRAHIELDPLFLETVTIDERNPMRVFVQLQDDCEGTFVKPRTTGFDVAELRGGTSNAHFIYRVMAKRKDFEEKRLDYCAAAERDSYLYPELREKEEREREARNPSGER